MPPRFVFGGGGIGGAENSFTYAWNTPDKVRQLLQELKKLGLEEIDSAASYPPGNPWNTETLLGQTCAGRPEGGGFVIDSKIAAHLPGRILDDESIEASLTKTLELLQVPKVHILYAHRPDKNTPLEETAKAFDRQFKVGKFEKLGLCNFSVRLLSKYFAICDAKGYVKPSVIQDHYNLLQRTHEDDGLFSLIRQHGCAYFAYSPLAGGFLTGKVTLSRDASDGELKRTRWDGESVHPAHGPHYDAPAMHDAARRLMKACKESSPPITMAEASLRWLVHHSALQDGDAVIIGASKVFSAGGEFERCEEWALASGCTGCCGGTVEVLCDLRDLRYNSQWKQSLEKEPVSSEVQYIPGCSGGIQSHSCRIPILPSSTMERLITHNGTINE